MNFISQKRHFSISIIVWHTFRRQQRKLIHFRRRCARLRLPFGVQPRQLSHNSHSSWRSRLLEYYETLCTPAHRPLHSSPVDVLLLESILRLDSKQIFTITLTHTRFENQLHVCPFISFSLPPLSIFHFVYIFLRTSLPFSHCYTFSIISPCLPASILPYPSIAPLNI